MSKIYFIIISIFLLFGCKNNKQQTREPINHNIHGIDTVSIERNKKLNKKEEIYIKNIIKKDSSNNYINSGYGFWYYIIKKNPKAEKVKTNDKIIINYEIYDLSDNIIYSSKEIGEKNYHVDYENYFRGFHQAVKLLREGETGFFIFPSNSAYGYHGDEKRIGQSIPLKMKLTIIKINKDKKL